MKKIIFEEMEKKVLHDEVNYSMPVFAKKNRELAGMLVREDRGWVLRLGGATKIMGYHPSPQACMKAALSYGYTFHAV